MIASLNNHALQNHNNAACDYYANISKTAQKNETDYITPSLISGSPMDLERPEKGDG
jgi:hypothetical protein